MADGATELTWEQIKDKAESALDATIRQLELRARAEKVQRNPVPWRPGMTHIKVFPRSEQRVFWKEGRYFAIAEGAADVPDNRTLLESPSFNPRTGQLTLSVPESSRADLAAASSLFVCRFDDQSLKLELQLREALGKASRGPRVEDLWSRQRQQIRGLDPEERNQDPPPNPGQATALAAMTSPGGTFVWGPPGTGKTTVITGAVRDALRKGRSVLLTSHTHVAVDNVLEALIKDDRKSGPGLLRLGQVVRHAPQDERKVLGVVREHPHLLVDKAAAVAVRQAARAEELRALVRANEEHPDRDTKRRLRDELDDAKIDISEVLELKEVAGRAVLLDSARAGLGAAQLRHHAAQGVAESWLSTRRSQQGAVDAYEAAERARLAAESALTSARHELDRAESFRVGAWRQLEEARAVLAEAENASSGGWTLPWVARRRRQHAESCQLLVLARTDELDRAWVGVQEAGMRLDRADAEAVERRGQSELLTPAARAARDTDAALARARADEESAAAELLRLAAHTDELASRSASEADRSARATELEAAGAFVLVDRHQAATTAVDELDDERKELEVQRKKLQDEFQQKRESLLLEAPVVASTLTSLCFNPQLLQRRFDIVIIDEAASAEAASIVYAGSRADHSLALVGDFLQNAPIAEADDAVDDAGRERVAWQMSDVFELAGIKDKQSAEEHARCVALVRQYRYPSVIANVVNAFCYEGVLQSERESTAADGITIAMIDTSSTGARLVKTGSSWTCEPTQLAAMTLAQELLRAFPGESLGFVCPYAPQAAAMTQRFDRARLDVPSGTAHKFQGREFDRVIFDLMQDDTDRWVAAADIRGPRRAVSAAKLLNVSLTRAKEGIFILGNWDFIRGHDSPGMRALAALEGLPNFEVRDLTDWLPPQ